MKEYLPDFTKGPEFKLQLLFKHLLQYRFQFREV